MATTTDEKRAILKILKQREEEIIRQLQELQMRARSLQDACTDRADDDIADEAGKLHPALEEAQRVLEAWDK